MISHKYKCIFIHIPKCAGTSIERALGHFEYYSGRKRQDHRSIRMILPTFVSPKVFSSKENIFDVSRRVKNKFAKQLNPNNRLFVTKKQYNEYFKFTFVRNPWARAYSCYKGIMRDAISKERLNIDKEISMEKFFHLYLGKGLLRPQTYWIKDFTGNIPLDFIGYFENLHSDFSKVCKILGVDNIELPHELKGSNTCYKKEYNTSCIEMVNQIYQEEIKLFRYHL